MGLFTKPCKKCSGLGKIPHPVEPRLVDCNRCKGKGKVKR